MKDIITWLLGIEHLASELYRLASGCFVDDKKLHKFLVHNAEDEAWHYHVMGCAANQLQQDHFPISKIVLDDEIKERIETEFRKNIEAAANNTLTKEQLIDCIVDTEFSEWNIAFLYVVDAFKSKKREYEYASSEMQHHLTHIEHFIQNESAYPEKIDKLLKLTAVYKEKILVVEDDTAFAGLLKAILSKDGNVHTVVNGREAIKKVDQHYYKLIVSDIDMPVMDGFTFYKKAVAKFPGLHDRIIFLTGDLSADRASFCAANNVPCLQKPASIKDIRRLAAEIMYRMDDEKP